MKLTKLSLALAFCGGASLALMACNSGTSNVSDSGSTSSTLSAKATASQVRQAKFKAQALKGALPVIKLCQGYNVETRSSLGLETAYSSCDTSAKNVNITNAVNDLTFEMSASQKALEEKFNISAAFGADMPAFGANAAANYVSGLQETNSSVKMSYVERYEAVAQLDKNPLASALSEDAKELYADLGLADLRNEPDAQEWADWYDTYGSSYVSALNVRGILSTSVDISFSSSANKKLWNLMLNGNLKDKENKEVAHKSNDLFNLGANLEYFMEATQSNVTLKIAAHQEGGNPEQLVNIFKDSGSNENITTDSPLLTCSVSNLDKCRELIANVLTYAANDFPKQIKNESGKVDYTKLYNYGVNSYTIYPTTKFKLPMQDYQLTSLVNNYASQSIQDQKVYSFIQAYLDDTNTDIKNTLAKETKERLEAFSNQLKTFIGTSYLGGSTQRKCFSGAATIQGPNDTTKGSCATYIKSANIERDKIFTTANNQLYSFLLENNYVDTTDAGKSYFQLTPVSAPQVSTDVASFLLTNVNYHANFANGTILQIANSGNSLKIEPSVVEFSQDKAAPNDYGSYTISTKTACPVISNKANCQSELVVSIGNRGTEAGAAELKTRLANLAKVNSMFAN